MDYKLITKNMVLLMDILHHCTDTDSDIIELDIWDTYGYDVFETETWIGWAHGT